MSDNLAGRLSKAAQAAAYVQKQGRNAHFNYKYATAADVLEKVNAALTAQGICTTVDVDLLAATERARDTLYTVKVRVHYRHAGEEVVSEAIGQGADNADKGIAKAQTMAMKYAHIQALMIATGDDPEEDHETDRRAQLPEVPEVVEAFRGHVSDFGDGITYEQAAGCWLDHRASLGADYGQQEWKWLLTLLPDVPKPKSRHAELKRAVEAAEKKFTPPDGPKGGGRPAPETGPVEVVAEAQPVRTSEDSLRAHLGEKTNRFEAENSIRKHRAEWPLSDDEVARIAVETLAPLFDSPLQCANAVRVALRNAHKRAA